MKKQIIRLLALLLVFVMACSLLISCASNEDDVEETGVVTLAQEDDGILDQLDWQGREFKILATHNAYEPNFEIVGDISGDKLSQVIYSRNIVIKEFCNAEIVDVAVDENTFSALEKDYESGGGDYDLVFLIRNDMASAIQRGFMKDLTKVEYINLENEWYNPLAIESMKISGKLYHMTSSFSLTDKSRTATLFYNRDMADRFNLGIDVISEVRAGTWTIDKMYQMINTISASGDTNGNGQVDKNDTFGVSGCGSESATAFWAGMGNKLVNFNNGTDYGAEIMSDRSLKGLDTIKNMFSIGEWKGFTGSESRYWQKDYDAPITAFIQERALFAADVMGSIETIAEGAKFAYTAITFPKYDEDQPYYYTTNDNTYSSSFGIPYMADDHSFSGYMIEVLSWKSHTTSYPEYYQVKCMVQKSYDPICAEMLQLNFEGLVFDFGFMFAGTVNYKRALETYTTNSTNTQGMSSLYESQSIAANNSIQGIIFTIDELPE